MTTYKKLTWDSYKIQVESAVRDGNGATISTTYATKTELTTGLGNKLDTTVAASTYAPLTKLTDGSVTKVGTANVGTDTKPIKLVGGVPTAVINDLVDTATAQTISGAKTFSTNPTVKNGLSATDGYITLPTRAYDSANINDAVTIGSLAANPNVVHTTGNETIDNNKTFTGQIIANNSIRIVPVADIRRGVVTRKANSSDELYFMGNYLDSGPFEITYVPTSKILFQAYSDRLYSGTNPTNEQAAIRNIKIVSGTPTGGQNGDIAISINNGIYARSSGTWSKVL